MSSNQITLLNTTPSTLEFTTNFTFLFDPSSIFLSYNNQQITDFTLSSLSSDLSVGPYLITFPPYITMSSRDIITLLIKDTFVISDTLILAFAERTFNGSTTFPLKLDNILNGNYMLVTESIGSVPFIISSNEFTICNDIDLVASYINVPTLITSNSLPIHVYLFDSHGANVPNGKYKINFKLDKISSTN